MPAIGLAAPAGRRLGVIDLAVEAEKRGFTGIYCPSSTSGGQAKAVAELFAAVE